MNIKKIIAREGLIVIFVVALILTVTQVSKFLIYKHEGKSMASVARKKIMNIIRFMQALM